MLGEQEAQLLAWAARQPESTQEYLRALPRDVLSDEGQEALHNLEPFRAEPPPPNGFAAKYLRDQLLSVIGKAIGRAQRNGSGTHEVRRAVELLDQCDAILTPPPIEAFAAIVPGVREVIPTGIEPLDEQIQGLAKGELGIIGGPSGKGKSLVLINMAVTAAMAGTPVLYVTVADAATSELVTRIDTCIIEEPCPPRPPADILAERHRAAVERLQGKLDIADFTDTECALPDIERALQSTHAELVIVDHADDLLPPYGDPLATRHSLRAIYLALKKMATKWNRAVWTASQTSPYSWAMDYADITSLSESKVGKATGSSIVLVLTGGREPTPGIMLCHIAKARRAYTEATVPLKVDLPSMRVW